LGEASGRSISFVQQHAITNTFAGIQSYTFAVATARAPLSAHTFPATQTTSLGTILRGSVRYYVIIPSEYIDNKFKLTTEKTKKKKILEVISSESINDRLSLVFIQFLQIK